jgi:hypothetical protein
MHVNHFYEMLVARSLNLDQSPTAPEMTSPFNQSILQQY